MIIEGVKRTADDEDTKGANPKRTKIDETPSPGHEIATAAKGPSPRNATKPGLSKGEQGVQQTESNPDRTAIGETPKQRAQCIWTSMSACYIVCHKRWLTWRNEYHEYLSQHTEGVNLGFPHGWSPDWTVEVFNEQYQWRDTKLLETIEEAEGHVRKVLAYREKVGLPMVDWQPLKAPRLEIATFRKLIVAEAAKRAAVKLRDAALVKCRKACAAREAWREDYALLMQKHLSGVNPGFPDGWDSSWNREEFDLAHPRRARELSSMAVLTEDALREAVRKGQRHGIPPLPWQISMFDEQPGMYTDNEERALIASAPAEKIMGWLSGLPADPRHLRGDRLFDWSYNPGGYVGTHGVEYPDDMDLEPCGDLDPGDSFSCCAGEERGRLSSEWRSENGPARARSPLRRNRGDHVDLGRVWRSHAF